MRQLFTILATLSACAATGCVFGGSGDDGGDADGGSEPLTCNAGRLEERDAHPFETITADLRIGDLNDEQLRETNPRAEISLEGTETVLGEAPVYYSESRESWVVSAPLHPDGLDGGELLVRIVGDNFRCPANRLQIDELQEHPGALEDLLAAQERRVLSAANRWGYSKEQLLTLPLAEVPLPLMGPALMLTALESEDPNALRRIAAGTAADQADFANELRLLEAMIGTSGLLDEEQDSADEVEAIPPYEEPLLFERVEPAMLESVGRVSSALENQCAESEMPMLPSLESARRLSQMHHELGMNSQESTEYWNTITNGMRGVREIGDGLDYGLGDLTMGVITLHELDYAWRRKTLPTYYANGEVALTIVEFPEEDDTAIGYLGGAPGTGDDTPAYAFEARSSDFEVGGEVVDWALDQALAKVEGLDDKVDLGEKFAGDDWLTGFSGPVRERLSGWLGGACVVPAKTYRLSATTGQFINIVHSGSVDQHLGNLLAYEPVAAGPGVIDVSLDPADFPASERGAIENAAVAANVSVQAIEVQPWVRSTYVEPNDRVRIYVNLENVEDRNDVDWRVLGPDARLERVWPLWDPECLGYDVCAEFLVEGSWDRESDIYVKVESTTDTGARQPRFNPPERAAVVRLVPEYEVTVYPKAICVETDEPKTFTAEVEGDEENRVTWSSTATIGVESGVFRAGSPGIYTVTASAYLDPSATDEAIVDVGCRCYYNARFSGGIQASYGAVSTIAATYVNGDLSVQMRHEDTGALFTVIALDIPEQIGTYEATFTATLGDTNVIVDGVFPVESGTGRLVIDKWEDGELSAGFTDTGFSYIQLLEEREAISIDVQFDFEALVTEVEFDPLDPAGTLANCSPPR